jgi:hypothetical protein
VRKNPTKSMFFVWLSILILLALALSALIIAILSYTQQGNMIVIGPTGRSGNEGGLGSTGPTGADGGGGGAGSFTGIPSIAVSFNDGKITPSDEYPIEFDTVMHQDSDTFQFSAPSSAVTILKSGVFQVTINVKGYIVGLGAPYAWAVHLQADGSDLNTFFGGMATGPTPDVMSETWTGELLESTVLEAVLVVDNGSHTFNLINTQNAVTWTPTAPSAALTINQIVPYPAP